MYNLLQPAKCQLNVVKTRECSLYSVNKMKQNQTLSILIWAFKRKASDKVATLYARITVAGKRSEISLSRKIDLSLWDETAGLMKVKSESLSTKHILERPAKVFFQNIFISLAIHSESHIFLVYENGYENMVRNAMFR